MAAVSEVFKNIKKHHFKQDADGNEIQVEVREDVEQSEKLQAIIDLLVAAGYFRARIKGLAPFDKVVGGMTWCIESCNVDVDVDLLFQENLTIGQKIALTEKIVAVLPKMKCPHIIEPHQIQGLDFIHIFPVIQWLVKRSMEFRQEMASFVRAFAVSQFTKVFATSGDQQGLKKEVINNLNIVKQSYRPHRYYRRKDNTHCDIDTVPITLLEYGQPGDVSNITSSTKSDTGLLEMQSSQDNFLSYDTLDEQELKSLKRHYASLQLELKDGSKASEENQKLTLEEQKSLITKRNMKLNEQKDNLDRQVEEDLEYLNQIRSKQQEANEALQNLEQNEEVDPKSISDAQDLVILSDSLKNQEVQFREHCQKELTRLKTLINEMKNISPAEDNPAVNEEIETVNANIKQVRLQLAKKNRIVAALQRELDEVPNRAELAQYQRRFLELYNQISAKHKETKQYYTLYNTLEDTKVYMTKELSLLNSISDNYLDAMASQSSKEDFLIQFQKIIEGVKASKFKVEQKLQEEKKRQQQSNAILLGLIEQQRKYFSAVRQLINECRKQEILFK